MTTDSFQSLETIQLNKSSRIVKAKASDLAKCLPQIAESLIRANSRMTEEQKEIKVKGLNTPNLHAPKYHQWSELTHSIMVSKALNRLVDEAEKSHPEVKITLDLEIDGISRHDLLINFAGLLHDLGKWSDCFFEIDEDGKQKYDKSNNPKVSQAKHEAASGIVILGKNEPKLSINSTLFEGSKFSGTVFDFLSSPSANGLPGLTESQIQYLADVSRYHFELGIVRKFMEKNMGGFTMENLSTTQFEEQISKILSSADASEGGLAKSNYSLEIVLFFLADSAAKIDKKFQDLMMEELLKQYALRSKTEQLRFDVFDTLNSLEKNEILQKFTQEDIKACEEAIVVSIEERNTALQEQLDKIPQSDTDASDKYISSLKQRMIEPALKAAIIQYPINLLMYYKSLEIWKRR